MLAGVAHYHNCAGRSQNCENVLTNPSSTVSKTVVGIKMSQASPKYRAFDLILLVFEIGSRNLPCETRIE